MQYYYKTPFKKSCILRIFIYPDGYVIIANYYDIVVLLKVQ